jgi:hypothetical protein
MVVSGNVICESFRNRTRVLWAVWPDKAVWQTARQGCMDVHVELEMPASSSPIDYLAGTPQ